LRTRAPCQRNEAFGLARPLQKADEDVGAPSLQPPPTLGAPASPPAAAEGGWKNAPAAGRLCLR